MRTAAGLGLVVAVAAAMGWSGSAAGAGSGTTRTASADFRVLAVDSSSYPSVESIVVVPRALSGRDLGSDAFAVSHAGASQAVEAERLDPGGLELVMVVDPSVGTDSDFRRAQGALLEVPVHLPGARYAVIDAAAGDIVVSPITADAVVASQAVRSMTVGGSTALVEAVRSALGAFSPETARADTRRAILLLAGDAEVDPYDIVGAALRARRMGVTVYVITPGERMPVDLERLASMTSGRALAAGASGVVAAVDRTVAELRSQYRLRFELPDGGDAGDLSGEVPGEVVAAVGVQPVAAEVNADGTNAQVELSVPPPQPSPGTAPEPGIEPPSPSPVSTGWYVAVGALLLVLAAAGLNRVTAKADARLIAVDMPGRRPAARVARPVAAAADHEHDAATLAEVGTGPS